LYALVSSGLSLFNQSILAERHFGADVFFTLLKITTFAGMLSNLTSGWSARYVSYGKLMAVPVRDESGACLCLWRGHGHLRRDSDCRILWGVVPCLWTRSLGSDSRNCPGRDGRGFRVGAWESPRRSRRAFGTGLLRAPCPKHSPDLIRAATHRPPAEPLIPSCIKSASSP
jgi:hypothetical protein